MSSWAALATAYGVSGRSVAVSAIGYADESCAPYSSALPTTNARTLVAGGSDASKRIAPSALISNARIGDALASGANAMPARWTTRSGVLVSRARRTLSSDVTSRGVQQIAFVSAGSSVGVFGGPSSVPAKTVQPRSSMARDNHCPTNPAPPVINARCDMMSTFSPQSGAAPDPHPPSSVPVRGRTPSASSQVSRAPYSHPRPTDQPPPDGRIWDPV